jgi:hypothetical protein
MQGRAIFWFRLQSNSTHGTAGQVLFKLYGQKCDKCSQSVSTLRNTMSLYFTLRAMNYLDNPIVFRNMKHLYGIQKKYSMLFGTCTSKLVNAITAVRLLLAPAVYELASRYVLIAQTFAKRAVMEFANQPTKNKVLNLSLSFLCRIILFHCLCQILSAAEAFVFIFSDKNF